MRPASQDLELPVLTAQIVSAHCANSTVEAAELPRLIRQLYAALMRSGQDPAPAVDKPVPAVPPMRSIFADYVVCLGDGAKLKMLKRHLLNFYGLMPTAYLARWNLPELPDGGAGYATQRGVLAKEASLGRRADLDSDLEQTAASSGV